MSYSEKRSARERRQEGGNEQGTRSDSLFQREVGRSVCSSVRPRAHWPVVCTVLARSLSLARSTLSLSSSRRRVVVAGTTRDTSSSSGETQASKRGSKAPPSNALNAPSWRQGRGSRQRAELPRARPESLPWPPISVAGWSEPPAICCRPAGRPAGRDVQ